jgi:hypothetical protein
LSSPDDSGVPRFLAWTSPEALQVIVQKYTKATVEVNSRYTRSLLSRPRLGKYLAEAKRFYGGGSEQSRGVRELRLEKGRKSKLEESTRQLRITGCFPKGPFFTASLLSRPLWGGKLFEGEKEEKGSFSRSKRKEGRFRSDCKGRGSGLNRRPAPHTPIHQPSSSILIRRHTRRMTLQALSPPRGGRAGRSCGPVPAAGCLGRSLRVHATSGGSFLAQAVHAVKSQ